MNQLRFRTRLVLILSLFAIVPALVLTLLWSGTVSTALPFVTGRPAWDSVAASGEKAIAAARQAPRTAAQRRAIDAHERADTVFSPAAPSASSPSRAFSRF